MNPLVQIGLIKIVRYHVQTRSDIYFWGDVSMLSRELAEAKKPKLLHKKEKSWKCCHFQLVNFEEA